MDEIRSPRTSIKYPYFEEETSVQVVNARMGHDIDPRLREVMGVVVKHLHAAVKEIEPTHEEWLTAIKFLTDIGHMCTEWRQEFILLSDTLGVSMLVDSINHRRPSGATENTILGPSTFRTRHAINTEPTFALTERASRPSCAGELSIRPAILSRAPYSMFGRPTTTDFTDVQQKGVQPDFNLRGVFTTTEERRVLVPYG